MDKFELNKKVILLIKKYGKLCDEIENIENSHNYFKKCIEIKLGCYDEEQQRNVELEIQDDSYSQKLEQIEEVIKEIIKLIKKSPKFFIHFHNLANNHNFPNEEGFYIKKIDKYSVQHIILLLHSIHNKEINED